MSLNFVPENDELFNFRCNHHVLIEKEFIKYIRDYDQEVLDEKYIPPNLTDWYPLVNSYYEFAEDYDAVNRVSHLLHEVYSKDSSEDTQVTSQSQSDDGILSEWLKTTTNKWDEFIERKAQIAYLTTKPKCFLIIGKPGLGEEQLGKLLADYWKCVFIHPVTLINEEIRSGSRAGLCIEFNLRCGRAISVDVIIRLLEKRLNSEIVKHRGFVLCGFPLVQNDLFADDPVSSESAIFNVHEIFEDLIENVLETVDSVKHVSRTSLMGDDEEEEINEVEINPPYIIAAAGPQKVVRPSLDIGTTDHALCFQSHFHINDANQMDYVFSLLEDHDYLILYLKCHNEEVVNIRKDDRYDYQTLQPISIQRERTDNVFYTMHSMYPPTAMTAEDDPFLHDDETLKNLKTLKIQADFPAHVRAQLARYVNECQLVIEKYILFKNPEEIIKLDGRMSPNRLFQVLRMRLKILPLSPAILPSLVIQPNVEFDELGEDGAPPVAETTFNAEPPEHAFPTLTKKRALGPLYNWNLSAWMYYCPVAVKDGVKEVGKSHLAVQFMNKLFFLSNEERCNQFLRNPRPYLLPPMPLTVRRFYIVGPTIAGKSSIAKCIKRLTGGHIIDFPDYFKRYIKNKLSDLLNRVREDALRQALDNMKEMRKASYFQMEYERMRKLGPYLECIRKNLVELRDAFLTLERFQQADGATLQRNKSFMRASDTAEKLKEFRLVFNIGASIDCQNYLDDESKIMSMLPDDLQEPTVFTYDVVSTEAAYVLDFVASAVADAERPYLSQERINDPEEIIEGMKSLLDSEEQLISERKRSGWIIDGFPALPTLLPLLDKKHFPDVTLMVNSEDPEFIIDALPGDFGIEDSMIDEVFAEACVSGLFTTESLEETVNLTGQDDEFTMEQRHAEIANYFETVLPEFKTFYADNNYPVREVMLKKGEFKKALRDIIMQISTIDGPSARVVTQEEIDLERLNYGDVFEDVVGEEPGEGASDTTAHNDENHFKENRRLGNTADFDPVAFAKHGVLWKGREDLLVNYMNKMWLFANEEMMNEFIESPLMYSRHIVSSRRRIPPSRLCIVGNRKVGKSTQAHELCRRVGLYYCDFENEFIARYGAEKWEAYLNDEGDETLIKELIEPYWQDANKKDIGFVMDGFPRRTSDVYVMTSNYLIPDCVLELYIEPHALNARLLDILLAEWQTQLDLKKEAENQRNDGEVEQWRANRELEKKNMLEERRQRRYAERHEGEEEDFFEESETESLMTYKSYLDATDEKEIEEMLDETMPEPQMDSNWETIDVARERLQIAVDEDISHEPQFIEKVKVLVEETHIPWFVVNANMPQVNVYNAIMLNVMPYKFQNKSHFERAYDVSIELAEKLLESGYYFLSRFGKLCPVQMYEEENPIPMYLRHEGQFQLFPMIYANYIYFIGGVENRVKFKKDILKYLTQHYVPMPLFRTRVAVVGPPHCGKTTICERYKSFYALEHISVGKAVRHVLKYMPNSVLAQKMRSLILRGYEVPVDLAIECVEAMTYEPKALTLGYILDGAPNTIAEMKQLAQMNLVPHLIINLEASLEYIYEHMDLFPAMHRPEFSKKFIQFRYSDWTTDSADFLNWVDAEYQNIITISSRPSRWKMWTIARDAFLTAIGEIRHYHRFARSDMPMRVAYLLVRPYEVLCAPSEFKLFCPVCLYYTNELTFGGNPPDRTGLLYYHGKYYWLCNDHVDEFIDNPANFLGNNMRHKLPIVLPELPHFYEMPENVYNDGYCVVCLEKNKPDQVLNMGRLNLAVVAKDGKVYLFDKLECLRQFLKTPIKFSQINTNFSRTDFPPTDIKSLPTLGMLEQYVANQVVKALIEIENLRPLVAGLSVGQSACILLGMCLKINNPNTNATYIGLYEEAYRDAISNQLEVRSIIEEYKSVINPLLHYQEPLPPFKLDLAMLHKESTDSMFIRDLIDNMLDQIDFNEQIESYHQALPMSGLPFGG